MSELHVLMPDGQQSVCTEDQVNELLEQGVITLETYYWQEGMEEWRPLHDLATPGVPSAAPSELPSATPSEILSGPRSSVPSFVPPRRASNPELPSPQRPVFSRTAPAEVKPELDNEPSVSTSQEDSKLTENITQPKISNPESTPSLSKEDAQPVAKQLEFTDTQPMVSPKKEVFEPAAMIQQPQPLIAEPAIRFEKIESIPDPVALSPKRYEFRKSPLVLTVGLQILMVLSLLTMAVFLYQCYVQVYGGDDSTALLMGSAGPNGVINGVSDSDRDYFLDFIWILVGVEVLIESLFFCWVYLANFNCRGFIPNLTYTPGRAVACFFIPFLNLVRPYQVMQEIWKVSENPEKWLGKRNSVFVGLWFLCRLAIVAIIIISVGPFPTSYSSNSDPHVRTLGTLCYLMVVEAIVFFIELTTLILVSVVTARQMKLTRQ